MKEKILKLADRAEERCQERFRRIDRTAQENTKRVLDSFRTHRVAEACFAGTTGYGYDDLGRETLDRIYADLLGTESALVRIGFVNGTHALTSALFALARPGETILSLTGLPYDTLQEAIGIRGDEFGSLKFYGIHYRQVELDVLNLVVLRNCASGFQFLLVLLTVEHRQRHDVFSAQFADREAQASRAVDTAGAQHNSFISSSISHRI